MDAQTLSASGADVHGLEFAALDTLQQGLARHAVGQGGFEGGQPALGGVIDEQGADVWTNGGAPNRSAVIYA